MKLVNAEHIDATIDKLAAHFPRSGVAEEILNQMRFELSGIPEYDGPLTHNVKELNGDPVCRRFFAIFEVLIARGVDRDAAADVAARVAAIHETG